MTDYFSTIEHYNEQKSLGYFSVRIGSINSVVKRTLTMKPSTDLDVPNKALPPFAMRQRWVLSEESFCNKPAAG